MTGWIGFDLDGTLAQYDHWHGPTHIGDPIGEGDPESQFEQLKRMLERKQHEVRIFSARVYAPTDNALRQYEAAQAMIAIQEWCKKHFGKAIPVTCVKDFGMIEMRDDRAAQVDPNNGHIVGYSTRGL